jgi:hypothetical protein
MSQADPKQAVPTARFIVDDQGGSVDWPLSPKARLLSQEVAASLFFIIVDQVPALSLLPDRCPKRNISPEIRVLLFSHHYSYSYRHPFVHYTLRRESVIRRGQRSA